MELNVLQNTDNYGLYADAQAIGLKVDQQLASQSDFLLLTFLSKQFCALGKVRECLFCQKLQVKFLLQQYWETPCIAKGIDILKAAHDLALDIVTQGEAKKTIAPSFYKALLNVKIELANAKRSLGLLDEAVALEACARRICNKAHNLFPTYQNFPSQLLNAQ